MAALCAFAASAVLVWVLFRNRRRPRVCNTDADPRRRSEGLLEWLLMSALLTASVAFAFDIANPFAIVAMFFAAHVVMVVAVNVLLRIVWKFTDER